MLGVLGKYRLDQRLGGGGMAEVFLGSMVGAEGFSRKVAIKRVLPGYSENEAFAQMFVAEAKISSQLTHPNIVTVLDFDRDAEHRLFLVMELVDGKDLDALISSGPLPTSVVIFIIGEVLRGLGYAHDLPISNHMRGVVHRDVSPHNVLLSWSGAIKVSDFGIAKAREASEATASVFIKGKPAYMSPEQANGQALDGRSDLFAVGIMLWEMLLNRRLFSGGDTRSVLASVLFGQIPRPRSIRNDVPKDLERVCMKLLERDLPARYETAEHALHELLECNDAPKAGREQLVAVLADRFPAEAPVRHSRARSGNILTPPPHLFQSQPPGEMPSTTPGHHAMPSLGAVMNAPTGTMQPPLSLRAPGRSQMTKILIVLAVVLVSGVVTFAIAIGLRGSGSKTIDAGQLAVVPDAGPESGVALGPPADAPPVPPDAPVLPIDAPAPPADAQRQTPDAQKKEPTVTAKGSLNVAFPGATVLVRGKKLGDSPGAWPLLVGRHTIKFSNADAPYDNKTVSVTIKENSTTTVKLVNGAPQVQR
ncbi:MAG: serine/threonine-protein kinase [Kofleriaceae bacterium]